MKRFWFPFLPVILITACSGSAIPSAAPTAIPTATEIPPTETPAPTSTTESTATTTPTETPAPTDTPAATPTYDFIIMSTHNEILDGLIPLNPTDTPLTEACGAPIFNTAIAGNGDPANEYFYMTDSHPMDVYKYYMTEMPNQGWELFRISDDLFGNIPLASADLDKFHSSIMFLHTSGRSISIGIVKDFDNGHIYVWMTCFG